MADPGPDRGPHGGEREITLLALATVLLRWRRTIIALALVGGIVGLVRGLTSPRVYRSEAVFIPQGASESPNAGLAAAASQLGVRVPTTGGSWGPKIYIKVLHSRALLSRIALDTIVVTEQGGRRLTFADVVGAGGPTPAAKGEAASGSLRSFIFPEEVEDLGGVRVIVTSPWPSVSLGLAERLVHGVNQFNVETRKSQAAAERQFVEVQAYDAERALRNAEDRLQSFLQRNREITGSPMLAVERDRLQREVTLRQELHTSWLKSREDARIREVRDTPVITVFEEPRLAKASEPRGASKKAVVGAIAGGLLGVLIALATQMLGIIRNASGRDAREFFALLEQAKPRFLRKRP